MAHENKTVQKASVLVIFLLFFTLTGTQAVAAEFNYNFFDARLLIADFDGQGGFGGLAEISHDIGDNIRIEAAYLSGAADDVDFWLEDLYVGAGYIMELDSSTDTVFSAGYIQEWIETGFSDNSDSGLRLSAKVRHSVNNNTEVFATAHYADIWDTNTGIAAGVIFSPKDTISWGAEYELVEDNSFIHIFARFYR